MTLASRRMAWSQMYDNGKLTQEEFRLKSRLRELYVKVISPVLFEQEKHVLNQVRFEFPPRGKDPLDYYAGVDRRELYVAMPVLSLLFLEDLCTSYAWLHTHGFSLETIDEYVTMLRYKRVSKKVPFEPSDGSSGGSSRRGSWLR